MIKETNESICAYAEVLNPGQYLNLEENHIISNKKLTMKFRIDELSENDVIRLGHGETLFCSSYLELSKDEFTIYEYTSEANALVNRKHGIALRDFVSISIDVGYSTAKITILSGGGVYESEIIDRCWSGRNGMIFAVSKASSIKDVSLRWWCSDFPKSIWLFGDSYFNPNSELRWTYYLIKNGYTGFLMSGYPGRNSTAAIKDFKQALKHGKPKCAVWCLGMNDEDTVNDINESYLAAVNGFLRICKEEGITPILSTIPCVPERNHTYKNKWVKSQGLRYVDFAMAVGGEYTGSSWNEGMLYSDNVHPDVLGAKALYTQFVTDFPEILSKE